MNPKTQKKAQQAQELLRGAARKTKRLIQDRDMVRDRLVALGLTDYKPKPWSVERWEQTYGDGTLDYFGDLNERPRFSVLLGYLDFLGVKGRVLDAGCGNGFLFERARHLGFAEWRGYDLSSTAIDAAKQRAAGDARGEFIVEDLLAHDASWTGYSYECVIINEVLNMCDDPGRLLDLAIESLEPGGHVLISGWRHVGDRHLWQLIESRLETVDAVQLLPESNRLANKGWRVALFTPKVR